MSVQENVLRPTANFPPSVWGDQFLTYDEREDQAGLEKVVEDLKDKLRQEILGKLNVPTQHTNLLRLIDSIQRLGIAYHFEEEVDRTLHHFYDAYGDNWTGGATSVWFRVMRQRGFFVSSDLFKSYKDKKGAFKEPLENDIGGLLELYEATYLRVPGEVILDDALAFTKARLDDISNDPLWRNSIVSTQIIEALKQPMHKRLPRLEALRYIAFYQQQDSCNESLLKLAKLGFNLLQSLHKKELSQVYKYTKINEREDQAGLEKVVEDLKDKLRQEILGKLNVPTQHTNLLRLIDSIQRLGIEYHFEEEVDRTLHHFYDAYGDNWTGGATSVWFRVMRQRGFFVSSDLFKSYKDKNGAFKEPLENNIAGLLELYEATYLRVPGEVILDDALAFTKARLDDISNDPLWRNSIVSTQIIEALKQPMHKRLPRLEALHYIAFYQQQDSCNESLLKLAKLGFSLLQSLHKKELSQVYKWSVTCLDALPEKYKLVYRMLLSLYEDMEKILKKMGKAHHLNYVREAMMEYIGCYLKEAKWANEEYIPTMEEHKEVTTVSSGYKFTLIASFAAMGDAITDETFKWALTMPPLAKACCVLCRVMDDVVTHKEEQERKHVASGIQCYMKEFDVTEQHVYNVFNKKVEDAWVEMNEESLKCKDVKFPVIMRVINLARVMDVLYKNKDHYTHVGPELINHIKSLVVDPIMA
ncbi:Terpene synthase, metal-binding domain-containing protein [Artemisia annua]|uniref:Terpene synthase, metal-binding domain-containing protein n=1 Tax=Artemisia annua TaxID=35608 RepID=A0A2U1LVM4_ARTAN|nr:Terpene synthase, metal-binding domain-containing protein [Artemisia annua]